MDLAEAIAEDTLADLRLLGLDDVRFLVVHPANPCASARDSLTLGALSGARSTVAGGLP